MVHLQFFSQGTKGQNKLEGPIDQSKAIKEFEKKFHDKTKNKWSDRKEFKPVKGKYVLLIDKTSQSTSGNANNVGWLLTIYGMPNLLWFLKSHLTTFHSISSPFILFYLFTTDLNFYY